MGRKAKGIKQVKYDFTITPYSDHERYVVEQLNALRERGEMSRVIRQLVIDAFPLPGAIEPVLPESTEHEVHTEVQQDKPAKPKGTAFTGTQHKLQPTSGNNHTRYTAIDE